MDPYGLGIDPALARTAVCKLSGNAWDIRIARAPKPVQLLRSRISFALQLRKIAREWPDPTSVVIEIPPRSYSYDRRQSAERAAHICMGLWAHADMVLLEPGQIRHQLLGDKWANKRAVQMWTVETCKHLGLWQLRGADEVDAFAAACIAGRRMRLF